MYSSEGERVELIKHISTSEAKGAVEKWLVQVEDVMLRSVRDVVARSRLVRAPFSIPSSINIYVCKNESVAFEWLSVVVLNRLMLRLHEASGSRSGLGKWCFAPPRFSGPQRFMKPSDQEMMWVLFFATFSKGFAFFPICLKFLSLVYFIDIMHKFSWIWEDFLVNMWLKYVKEQSTGVSHFLLTDLHFL